MKFGMALPLCSSTNMMTAPCRSQAFCPFEKVRSGKHDWFELRLTPGRSFRNGARPPSLASMQTTSHVTGAAQRVAIVTFSFIVVSTTWHTFGIGPQLSSGPVNLMANVVEFITSGQYHVNFSVDLIVSPARLWFTTHSNCFLIWFTRVVTASRFAPGQPAGQSASPRQ